MKADFKTISYYDQPTPAFTDTMRYLVWFRFFVRNSDNYIRVPTPDSRVKLPSSEARLFYMMRSSERTHVPCTYTINTKKPLTYPQWCELIATLHETIESEINKTLQIELYERGYLEWNVCEFIGWTTDGLVQNPEENKQAFRFTGHIT